MQVWEGSKRPSRPWHPPWLGGSRKALGEGGGGSRGCLCCRLGEWGSCFVTCDSILSYYSNCLMNENTLGIAGVVSTNPAVGRPSVVLGHVDIRY
jgi:hypothetical protein